jgi:polysaccharide biosynthesis/export protein
VSVEGEVSAPGIYQLSPGETLRQMLQRAGGLTPQAYLYGLDFSREETRRRQIDNLKQAMARLQALSATQAARDAANRRDDPTIGAVSAAATQAQLSRLSQVEPNGRIALELTVQSTTIDALPELPLEHGDRIIVPARPGFVTVAGAVVNNNAFLWKPGRTAGDYVKLAGLDEAAEPSAMFILRADGTVSHANDAKGLFGYGGLRAQPLYPGDAVFVPNQLDFETWGRAFVRNLKDFSLIFSQFGLGVAAINTLK